MKSIRRFLIPPSAKTTGAISTIHLKKITAYILILFFCSGRLIPLHAQNVSDVKRKNQLELAVFDVNATPPIESHLAYQTMANSDNLSLRAKGVVIVGSGDPIILCSIDWIGLGNESQDLFKASLAEAAGTTPDRVAVHTVHQHDAPICDFTAERILKDEHLPVGCFDGTFARQVLNDLQQAIRQSLKNLQPVTAIGQGKAEVYQVASNRRVNKVEGKVLAMRGSSCKDADLRAMPEGLIDPELSLLSFWNQDAPIAVLSFYATHPQSYYQTQIANPDFPGIARYFRQLAVPDALHIHFNGAGGNIAAGKYNDGSHKTRLLLAERMADGMKRAWEKTVKETITSTDIQWITQPVSLPYNSHVKTFGEDLHQKDERHFANTMGRFGWYKRRLEEKTIDLACLSIKDARLLFLPGEAFVEYQLAAKKMMPNRFVAMAAYGDYGPLYIGTKEAYHEGGYEVSASAVTEDAEEIIMNSIETLFKKAENCNSLLNYIDQEGRCQQITREEEWQKYRENTLIGMEKVMGKLPSSFKKDLIIHYTDSSTFKNYIRYSIHFDVADSETVYAYLYKPLKSKKKKTAAILALHSTGGEGKRIIDGTTEIKNRAYAKELAERGYVVIAPDYPDMGELSNYDFEHDRYESGTMKGVFNHISCVNLLQSLNYVDTANIGVIGHSLGGHNAIFVAAFDPRLKVVVASCGWTLMDYYDIGEEPTKLYGGRLGPWAQSRYMPLIKTKYQLQHLPFDFDRVISTLAPRAFFTNSPTNDTNFSVDGVKLAVERFTDVYHYRNAGDKLKIVYPNIGHDFPKNIREAAYDFMDKNLKFKPLR